MKRRFFNQFLIALPFLNVIPKIKISNDIWKIPNVASIQIEIFNDRHETIRTTIHINHLQPNIKFVVGTNDVH